LDEIVALGRQGFQLLDPEIRALCRELSPISAEIATRENQQAMWSAIEELQQAGATYGEALVMLNTKRSITPKTASQKTVLNHNSTLMGIPRVHRT